MSFEIRIPFKKLKENDLWDIRLMRPIESLYSIRVFIIIVGLFLIWFYGVRNNEILQFFLKILPPLIQPYIITISSEIYLVGFFALSFLILIPVSWTNYSNARYRLISLLKDPDVKIPSRHRWESRLLALIGYLIEHKTISNSDVVRFLRVVHKSTKKYKEKWKLFLDWREETKSFALKNITFKIEASRKETSSESNYGDRKRRTEKKLLELFKFACLQEAKHFKNLSKHRKTYVIPYYGIEITLPEKLSFRNRA